MVDSALYEAVLQVLESVIPEYDAMGLVRQRAGAVLPGIAPSNVYRCRDGEFMIGGNGDPIFARLCTAMAQPELSTDPRYATHAARGARQAELDALIEAWTQTLTVAQVEQLMIDHAVPAGRLYTGAEMLADPHFAARAAIAEIAHPALGTLRMQAPMPKL